MRRTRMLTVLKDLKSVDDYTIRRKAMPLLTAKGETLTMLRWPAERGIAQL